MSTRISTKRVKKGLEPLIAAIVLIAITLIVAIAVAAWVTGLFASTTGAGVEKLYVYPNATLKKINPTTWQFNASVTNVGAVNSTIVGVTVGFNQCSASTNTPVNVGQTVLVSVNIPTAGGCNYINGTTYQVQIITQAGNAFYTVVVAG
ncbi:MAG: archaellin/type IV pilin N-terminal domain-containing protein [Sulfolobales archaeon]